MTKTSFDPEREVTKLQAIIVASRLLPNQPTEFTKKMPYNDINKYKWAKKDIQKAYDFNIISNSEKLQPNKKITKAELISLLYKTSTI